MHQANLKVLVRTLTKIDHHFLGNQKIHLLATDEQNIAAELEIFKKILFIYYKQNFCLKI